MGKKKQKRTSKIDIDQILYKNRQLFLFGEIDKTLTKNIVKRLRALANINSRPIILWINSPGGDMSQGFAIIDAIQGIDCPVITVIIGNACIARKSKIIMSDFTEKNIEDIKIGDEIWGFENNRLTKTIVKNKIFKGTQKCVKIETSVNRIWATPDHQFFVNSGGIFKWKPPITHYKKRKDNRSLCKVLDYSPIKDKKLYKKGFVCGLIDSDGCRYIAKKLKSRILIAYAITQYNRNILEEVTKILNEFNILSRIQIRNKRNDLLITHTKDTLMIDNWFNVLDKYRDKDLMKGYLAGFFIGDGNFIGKEKSLTISQAIKNKKQIKRLETIRNDSPNHN